MMRKLMMAIGMAMLLSTQPLMAQEVFKEMQYSPKSTVFTLNAPTCPTLRLYRMGRGGKHYKKIKMKSAGGGSNVWTAEVKGDLKGVFYTFDIGRGETPGVFAKAVGCNGGRAAVVDMRETNPTGWENDHRLKTESPADLVLYELHHRDFSIDMSSGLVNKGKFLALTEKKAIDHLKTLGVNAVHILSLIHI